MNDPMREQFERQLDAYLDGRLSPAEQAAFERQLQQDAALRAQADAQRQIDAAVQRLYAPTGAERVFAQVEAALGAKRTLKLRRPRWMRWGRIALAAMLLITVGGGGGWLFDRWLNPRRIEEYEWRSFETVYNDELATGFQPHWVCKNEQEFVESFQREFGQSLSLKPLPAEIATVGLDYSCSISKFNRYTYLLARVKGKETLVFVAPLSQKPVPEALELTFWGRKWKNLHVFRKQIGALQLYEVSPFDCPRVLDFFYQP